MKREVFLVRNEHGTALAQARVSRYWRHDSDANRRTQDEYRRAESIPHLQRGVDAHKETRGKKPTLGSSSHCLLTVTWLASDRRKG